MKLAAFLIGRRPMHPEHAEHHAATRTIRLEGGDVRNVIIVFRCGRVGRARIVLAKLLMRLAARVGGFKAVKMVK